MIWLSLESRRQSTHPALDGGGNLFASPFRFSFFNGFSTADPKNLTVFFVGTHLLAGGSSCSESESVSD